MDIAFEIKEQIEKLNKVQYKDQLRLIYEWAKTGVINLAGFKYLVETFLSVKRPRCKFGGG